MRREKAEITVETAIVMMIIMILICTILFFVLYLHDLVSLKSYSLSGLVDSADKDGTKISSSIRSKINKTPLFVIRPSVRTSDDFNKHYVEINEGGTTKMPLVVDITKMVIGEQRSEVVKKMPIDKMYLFKAIKDGFVKN